MCPQHLVVHSADRQTGNATDFRVVIPTFSKTGAVALLSASIPNTLYNVYDTCDTIYWNRSAVNYSAVLSHGAYGITDLVSELGSLMTTTDAGGGYSISYSPVTMKLTVTSTDATFYLRLSVQTNSMWEILGWTSTTNTAPALTQTGDSVVRLDFPPYLCIDIGLPGQDVVNTAWVRANYIVPMQNISQYVEVYHRNSTFDQLQCYSLGAGINTLNVKLTRPDGQIADLNGAEFSFVIGIEHPN